LILAGVGCFGVAKSDLGFKEGFLEEVTSGLKPIGIYSGWGKTQLMPQKLLTTARSWVSVLRAAGALDRLEQERQPWSYLLEGSFWLLHRGAGGRDQSGRTGRLVSSWTLCGRGRS
jgi:hypothetical protein